LLADDRAARTGEWPVATNGEIDVLILEDRPEDAELMLRELRQAGIAFRSRLVDSAADFAQALDRVPDVILADYHLPQFNALEALRMVQRRGLDVPMIVVTGSISEEVAVDCMKQGASDYLLKDRLARLGPSVASALAEKELREAKREAEAALRESDARFRQLVDHIDDIFWLVSADGSEVIYVSPAYERITGRRVDDLYRRPESFLELVHPNDRPRLLGLSRSRLAEELSGFEHRLVRDDGAIRWLHYRCFPVCDARGRVYRLAGITSDVTQRKQAAEALRETKEFFSTLLEHSALPIFVMNTDHRYRLVNRAWEAATGVSRSKAIGRAPEQLFSRHVAAQIEETNRRVLETGLPLVVEFVFNRPGHQRVYESTKFPIRNAEGHIDAVAGVALDVTQRRRAELAMRESEQRFRVLSDAAFEGIVIVEDGTIIDANSRFLEMIGETLDEVRGRPLEALIPQEQRATVRRHLADHQPPAHQHHLLRRDGRELIVESRARRTPYQGRVVSLIAMLDITERQRAEEEARHHLAELAHVTRLSTMGELVSELAHEINQPLYAIANFAEATKTVIRGQSRQPPDEQQQELLGWIEQIAVQANRAGEILRRVGRFVRKSASIRAPADINQIVDDCLKMLYVDVRLDEVEVRVVAAPNLPPVEVDRVEIEQVLVNLIRNAVEAMTESTLRPCRLTIKTSLWSPSVVEVSVRDTGPGIPLEDQPRLFEPFFTTKPGGMGMGLAISRSIIEAHHGRLWVESAPGRGTTIAFTLPAAKQEHADGQ
jgi:PAS domain S-box-containing protein